MPTVSIEERFSRARRAVSLALAWCADPPSDEDHETVQEMLKTALNLSVELEVIPELLSMLNPGGWHMGFDAWMRTHTGNRRDPFNKRLVLRLRDRWDTLLRLTTALRGAERLAYHYEPRLTLAISEIIDVAFEATARLDELRDTEIVTRSLTKVA